MDGIMDNNIGQRVTITMLACTNTITINAIIHVNVGMVCSNSKSILNPITKIGHPARPFMNRNVRPMAV
jgi:hypothetical protein